MTATITRAGRHVKPPRIRLQTMEVLGFIDTPGLTSTKPSVVSAPKRITADSELARSGRITEVSPTGFGDRYTRGNVRWGLVAALGLCLIVLIGAGVAFLRQTQESGDRVRSELEARAAELVPEVIALQELTPTLMEPTVDTAAFNQALLGVEAATRDLFQTAGAIGADDSELEASVVTATGNLMDTHHSLSQALSQRSAVIPVLAGPVMETDPGLISLEEAAGSFAEWQTRFDSVRSALPQDSTLADVMSEVSGSLGQIQHEYLDALATDDPRAAERAAAILQTRLGEVETVLWVYLERVVSDVEAALTSVRAELASLLG